MAASRSPTPRPPARSSSCGRADSANSWTVNIADLDPDTLDLTVRNPNAKEEKVMRAPREIAAEMAKLDKSNAVLLADILKALG